MAKKAGGSVFGDCVILKSAALIRFYHLALEEGRKHGATPHRTPVRG